MTNLQGKTVLVTGGTGFLGSVLVRRLVHEGAHVRAIMRRPERNKLLQGVEPLTLLAGDLANPTSLQEAISGCDIVFHVAVSYGKLDDQIRVNVEGTQAIAEIASRAHVQRFVHISSLAAYGYGVRGIVTEDTPLQPSREPYSTSKAGAERAILKVASTTGLSYSIVRPGGIYGAHSDIWTRTMFSVAKRKPLIFIGDGSGHAPLIYVDDLVELIVRCATHDNAHQQAFNAVYEKPITWRKYLRAYAKLVNNDSWLGIPTPIVRLVAKVLALVASKQSALGAVDEQIAYALSDVVYPTAKAQQLLGWQTAVTLEEGVQRCIPYIKQVGLLS